MSKINKNYKIKKDQWESATKMDLKEKISLMYDLYFQRYHYVAGHYFRHLYHILDFAEITKTKQNSMITDPNTKAEIAENFQKYVSFIQAQMSSYELMLLYYNSIAFPKMLILIKAYNLLENLSVEDLIDKSHDCIDGVNLKIERI